MTISPLPSTYLHEGETEIESKLRRRVDLLLEGTALKLISIGFHGYYLLS